MYEGECSLGCLEGEVDVRFGVGGREEPVVPWVHEHASPEEFYAPPEGVLHSLAIEAQEN